MKIFLALALVISIQTTTFAEGYKIGDSASDFNLINVDGKKLSMKEIQGAKGIILVFTCNHCPFSKAYEERIIQLDNKYASKGFPVIAINPNDPNTVPEDSYENMVSRAKEKSYPFPYLFDESQATAIAYGATRTPHVFILQIENEKIIVKYIGAIDNNSEEAEKADKKYVEDAVDALLTGKSIPVTETKAIGCTIKWKK